MLRVATIFLAMLIDTGSGSNPGLAIQVAPVPMPSELTDSETRTIENEKSPKSRIEAVLKASDNRLLTAYELSRQNQHQEVARHLKVSTSLIVYADSYSRQVLASRKKDLDNCLKRIEQTIFRQLPRLEAISRELPYELHEANVERLAAVRRIRIRAIDDLLGGGEAIR